MKALKCQNCGSPLVEKDGKLRCSYCGMVYDPLSIEELTDALSNSISEAKMETLAAARRSLYDLTHTENPSGALVLDAANKVLLLYPEDPLAQFYRASLAKDPNVINDFLLNANTDSHTAREYMRWMLLGMDARSAGAMSSFIDRHFEGQEQLRYQTELEKEVARLDEGVYDLTLQRDVFLAYSSKDQQDVVRVLDLLEANGFTVFAAFRNLRHGMGAAKKDNYEMAIFEAIKHCRCLVFLSSENSRRLSCDALSLELPFIDENLPEMGRVEYILNEPSAATPISVKMKLKSVFKGLEWCRDDEDLVKRVLDYTSRVPKKCPSCGAINPHDARHCLRCGYSFVGPTPNQANQQNARSTQSNAQTNAQAKPKSSLKELFGRIAAETKSAFQNATKKPSSPQPQKPTQQQTARPAQQQTAKPTGFQSPKPAQAQPAKPAPTATAHYTQPKPTSAPNPQRTAAPGAKKKIAPWKSGLVPMILFTYFFFGAVFALIPAYTYMGTFNIFPFWSAFSWGAGLIAFFTYLLRVPYAGGKIRNNFIARGIVGFLSGLITFVVGIEGIIDYGSSGSGYTIYSTLLSVFSLISLIFFLAASFGHHSYVKKGKEPVFRFWKIAYIMFAAGLVLTMLLNFLITNLMK